MKNKRKRSNRLVLRLLVIIFIVLVGIRVYTWFVDIQLFDFIKNELINKEIIVLQVNTDLPIDMSGVVEQDINYNESTARLMNPDRGFCYPALIYGTSNGFNYSQVGNAVSEARKNEMSLIHLRIDISKLSGRANGDKDLDLSDEDISDINKAFDLIRHYNMKSIVRVSYDYEGVANKEPDTLDAILQHIEQFKPIFETNKDVITVIEAGFIGTWGEMHSSEYANYQDICTIISALLESVPSTITVNVRTLYSYMILFGTVPVDENTAYNGSAQSRVGLYNDGYLGNESDLGTYHNREEALKFLESHAKYTIFGGETAGIDNKYNDIENVQEMFRTHTTYLNYVWHADIVQDKWGSKTYTGSNSVYHGQTAQKYIEDHLGYRFVLKQSEISQNVKPGEMVSIIIKVENTGFGNVVNSKNATLVLKKGIEYGIVNTNIDVRKWDSSKTTTEEMVFTIPSDIKVGEWKVYLKITDIDNEKYAIQFANDEIWENFISANYIGKFTVAE